MQLPRARSHPLGTENIRTETNEVEDLRGEIAPPAPYKDVVRFGFGDGGFCKLCFWGLVFGRKRLFVPEQAASRIVELGEASLRGGSRNVEKWPQDIRRY